MTKQEQHFDDLYAAFYTFYQAAITKADAPHKKVRLQLTTEFFDDLELLKVVQPVFNAYATTVAEKRACARTAYIDAMQLHNRTAGLQWETVSDKEIASGRAKGTY